MGKCCYCFTSLLGKAYFFITLTILVLMCRFLKDPNILNDGCFEDLLSNKELEPIYEIYISDSKTSESLQLGYLDDFSNKNIKIHSSEIYKWKDKYINVKRKKDADPIDFIIITNSSTILRKGNYKTIQINENNYLHYSNSKSSKNDIYDLKVSFREEPHPNLKRNSNICFSQNCKINKGNCLNSNNFEFVDFDSSENFREYNNIQIEMKNKQDFYDPNYFILYQRKRIDLGESYLKKLKLFKKLYIPFILTNLITRIIKYIFLIFLKVKICCCGYFTIFNLIFTLIEAINFIFLSFIFPNNGDINTDYSKGLDFPNDFLYILYVLEIVSFYCLFMNFIPFEREPSFCSCEKQSQEENNTQYIVQIENKNNEKNELLKKIEAIQNQVKTLNLQKEKNEKFLEECLIDMKKINISKEKIIHNLYIKRSYEIKINKYNNIENEIEKSKKILEKRKDELQKIKTFYNQSIKLSKIYTILNERKLKLNCIYLDKNINGEEDFSSSYEFFKLLKNSIDGVFFGIKDINDIYLLFSQPTEFKFILIYAGSDNEEDYNFLEKYHSKFSEILILAIDKDEIVKLKEIDNVIAVESEYYLILLKLINISYSFDKSIAEKYMPYSLSLYSDYINNNNIKKCHLELLNNTKLKGLSNQNYNELLKGLTDSEYNDFLSFLNDKLEEIYTTPNKKSEFDLDINLVDKNNDNDNNNIIINYITVKKNNNNKLKLKEEEPENNIHEDDKDSYDINNIERIPDINNIDNIPDINDFNNIPYINEIKNDSQNSEEIKITVKNKSNRVNNIFLRKEKKVYLGQINVNEKNLIKKFLVENDFKKSVNILKLYTGEDEKFYTNVNKWLFSYNINIYKEIGPIVGKIINFLYSVILKKNILKFPKILYRAFTIKKADIFLYKACEGDIFFYPAFTSTTKDEKATDIFKYNYPAEWKDLGEKCNCLIVLNYEIQNGDVLQEANISNYSKFEDEDESLFPPFSFFKIIKVYFNDGKTLNGEKIYNGTFKNPFKIELKIIKRDFYLDKAILNNEDIFYNKKLNKWVNKEDQLYYSQESKINIYNNE